MFSRACGINFFRGQDDFFLTGIASQSACAIYLGHIITLFTDLNNYLKFCSYVTKNVFDKLDSLDNVQTCLTSFNTILLCLFAGSTKGKLNILELLFDNLTHFVDLSQ